MMETTVINVSVRVPTSMAHETVHRHQCDVIITRNTKDFKQSDIPVFTPSDFLAVYLADKQQ